MVGNEILSGLAQHGGDAQKGCVCPCLLPRLFLSPASTKQLLYRQGSASCLAPESRWGLCSEAGAVLVGGCCRNLCCSHRGSQARLGAATAPTQGAAAVAPCQAQPLLFAESCSAASGCRQGSSGPGLLPVHPSGGEGKVDGTVRSCS